MRSRRCRSRGPSRPARRRAAAAKGGAGSLQDQVRHGVGLDGDPAQLFGERLLGGAGVVGVGGSRRHARLRLRSARRQGVQQARRFQQRSQPGEAASPGGSDAADRDVESARDLLVAGRRRRDEHPEQPLATIRDIAERPPEEAASRSSASSAASSGSASVSMASSPASPPGAIRSGCSTTAP